MELGCSLQVCLVPSFSVNWGILGATKKVAQKWCAEYSWRWGDREKLYEGKRGSKQVYASMNQKNSYPAYWGFDFPKAFFKRATVSSPKEQLWLSIFRMNEIFWFSYDQEKYTFKWKALWNGRNSWISAQTGYRFKPRLSRVLALGPLSRLFNISMSPFSSKKGATLYLL